MNFLFQTNSDGTEYESDDESSDKNFEDPPRDRMKPKVLSNEKAANSFPPISPLPTADKCRIKPLEESVTSISEPPYGSKITESGEKRNPKPKNLNPDSKRMSVNLEPTDSEGNESSLRSEGKRKRSSKFKDADLGSNDKSHEWSESASTSSQSSFDGLEESESFAEWVPPSGIAKLKIKFHFQISRYK